MVRIFRGWSKVTEALVDKYGATILDDIRNSSDFTIECKGITQGKAEMIMEKVRYQDPIEDAVAFLIANGLGNKQIIKITKAYGEESVPLIKSNPYRLVYDIDGIGFKTADKVAMSLGYDMDDPNRIEALMLDRYKTIAFGQGDSFISRSQLIESIRPSELERAEIAIDALIEHGELIEDEARLYHYTQYESETYVSDFLKEFTIPRMNFCLMILMRKSMRLRKICE
ncbi:hypothetical protein MGH68_12270 [Erysipelothrix sp. D19-032]